MFILPFLKNISYSKYSSFIINKIDKLEKSDVKGHSYRERFTLAFHYVTSMNVTSTNKTKPLLCVHYLEANVEDIYSRSSTM